ncbi:hypothetical protein SCLCIDRAFT_1207034 [Scleroderma citrinum Foug A]|uniref:Hydrophobin n=1 Tax=Scleroderma citrinum Foug A TaxID=1036808 RepID=A0A0C3AAP6_9AGAM|nr:hypothetical protein SCLCIDRAFT_1207034 [Scleroderma citrinum Foug A]
MALIGSCVFLPSSGLLLCAIVTCVVKKMEIGDRCGYITTRGVLSLVCPVTLNTTRG